MIIKPPEAGGASRALVRLLTAAGRLKRQDAGLLAVAGLIALALADWASGVGISLGFAYTLLVCFAAWTLGTHGATIFATVAILSVTAIRQGQVNPGEPLLFGSAAATWTLASRAISTFVMVSIVRALRHALELERWRAATDGLTGVLNKAAFIGRMDRTITRARAGRRHLVLLYVDLDGFKAVNDGHGHAAGDRVLCSFAGAAAAAVRERDLFARIGGDEFVALLTVRDDADGARAAEALHARLTAILAQTGFPVTCSMGAVVIDAAAAGTGDFIDLADALMYEVKRQGRNGLRIAHADSATAGAPHQPVPLRRAA